MTGKEYLDLAVRPYNVSVEVDDSGVATVIMSICIPEGGKEVDKLGDLGFYGYAIDVARRMVDQIPGQPCDADLMPGLKETAGRMQEYTRAILRNHPSKRSALIQMRTTATQSNGCGFVNAQLMFDNDKDQRVTLFEG